MMAGGFGIFWRRILDRMNQGSQTVSSWPMNFLVGTWKTSVVECQFALLMGLGRAKELALTVDFFESELLRFTDEAEYHAPGDQVQASVKADY
jgi:hypothetical protein